MPGWKRPNRTVSTGLCWLVASAACAAGPQAGAPRADAGAEGLPQAFLLFLGEWEDSQGDWQDPLAFEGPGWQVLDKDAEQSDESD